MLNTEKKTMVMDNRIIIEQLKSFDKLEDMLIFIQGYIESVPEEEMDTLGYKEIILFIDKYNLFPERLNMSEHHELSPELKKVMNQIEDEAQIICNEEFGKINENSKQKLKNIYDNNDGSVEITEHFALWYTYDYLYDIDSPSFTDPLKPEVLKTLGKVLVGQNKEFNIIKFIIDFVKKEDESLGIYLQNSNSKDIKKFLESIVEDVKRIMYLSDTFYKSGDLPDSESGISQDNYGDSELTGYTPKQ